VFYESQRISSHFSSEVKTVAPMSDLIFFTSERSTDKKSQ